MHTKGIILDRFTVLQKAAEKFNTAINIDHLKQLEKLKSEGLLKKKKDVESYEFLKMSLTDKIIHEINHKYPTGGEPGNTGGILSRAIGDPQKESRSSRGVTLDQAQSIAKAVGVEDWETLSAKSFQDFMDGILEKMRNGPHESLEYLDALLFGNTTKEEVDEENPFRIAGSFELDLNLWEILIIISAMDKFTNVGQSGTLHSHTTLRNKIVKSISKCTSWKSGKGSKKNKSDFTWDTLPEIADKCLQIIEKAEYDDERTQNLIQYYKEDLIAKRLVVPSKMSDLASLLKQLQFMKKSDIPDELSKNAFKSVDNWHQWQHNTSGKSFLKNMTEMVAYLPASTNTQSEDFEYYVEDQWSVIETAQRVLKALLTPV